MGYPLIQAKSISYGGTRALSSVKYIVIHYTGVSNDTAKNEVRYFANGNTRSAGAHYFVDQTGAVYQSIPINRAAWSVGGFYTQIYGAGSYYNKCTNYNSVSIEMCDNANKDPSAKQTAAVKKLVAYIQKQCPNAKTIIRHWDANGKSCPARMAGRTNSKWTKFKKAITGRSAPEPAKKATPAKKTTTKSYKVKVTADVLNVRTGPSASYKIAAKIKHGEVYTIVQTQNGWGKLKSGTGWINLSYTKKV